MSALVILPPCHEVVAIRVLLELDAHVPRLGKVKLCHYVKLELSPLSIGQHYCHDDEN